MGFEKNKSGNGGADSVVGGLAGDQSPSSQDASSQLSPEHLSALVGRLTKARSEGEAGRISKEIVAGFYGEKY